VRSGSRNGTRAVIARARRQPRPAHTAWGLRLPAVKVAIRGYGYRPLRSHGLLPLQVNSRQMRRVPFDTSPLTCRSSSRASSLWGMGESKFRFEQPDDVNPGPSHVVVHGVIRGFEGVRNRSNGTFNGASRSKNRRKRSRWTRPPRFRDREAPGSNPGPPTRF
jgi:hypothetical protein